MNQTRTKKILTKEEMEKEIEQWQEEKKREIALLDAPELSEEAKDLLVSIKRGLRDIQEGRVYTIEEVIEMLFGENGLCS